MSASMRVAALLMGSVGFLVSAFAQGGWPERPITLVVPSAAGGGSDSLARIYAQTLGAELGQPVVVDNRAGAGGNIGQSLVARAPRDGYTLLITGSGQFDANPALYKNAGFSPLKDFEPISLLATGAYLLVANKNFPPNTVPELIAYARSRPKEVFYGSAGSGTPNHLVGEMLKQRAGVDMVHVPYKGAAAAASDVIAGRVQWSLQSYSSIRPFIQSKDVKVIATIDDHREKMLANVPTLAETYPGLAVSIWYGAVAPAGLSPEILRKLRDASAKVTASKDFQDKLAGLGLDAKTVTPEQFRDVIDKGLATWAGVIKAGGITVD